MKNIPSRIILLLSLGIFLLSLTIIPYQAAGASKNPATSSELELSTFNLHPSTLDIPEVQSSTAGAPIYKYLIHQGTGGPVACGDSLVPLYVGQRTGDVKKDVTTALKSLFATGKYSGGLYNPLANSKLKVRRIEYIPTNKNAQVFLGGRLIKPTTYCEIARARAMVWATAQQFPEVRHATIWLGSALLGDLLAAKERAKN
jgi:hypothetical protein